MYRNFCFLLCALTFSVAPSVARATTFATSLVTAQSARSTLGHDAGVDVSGGRYVRLAASGAIALSSYGACPRSVGPRGCGAALSFSRRAPSAPTGSLVVAFVDRAGTPVSAWAAVGDAAYVAIPARAARMMLAINGANARDYGRFRVSVDVVGGRATADTAVAGSGTVHRLAVGRQVATNSPFTRLQAQHLLRRFGFSGSAADINAVYASGASAWLTAQLSPSSIDDSQLANTMQAMPSYTGNTAIDQSIYTRVQQRILERQISTKRQLLEKVTLHWLEHFAVSLGGVNDIGAMAHYEDTVRADALGNFAQLVSDVSKEPAMLYWLDNNYNSGANPATNPPNENFGRELMQLYVLGANQLNADGSTIVDSSGIPVPNYTEPDVKAVALALTGFEVHSPNPLPINVDPRTIDTVTFAASAHAQGPFTIINQRVLDPGGATIVDAVVKLLAHQSATAPFQSKELLQRFVTEDPSPGYVSRIAAVWSATADDPNQIAKVVAAVANDPEFATSVHGLVKEPVEFTADAVRGLGGANATALSYSATPFGNFINDDNAAGQPIYYPPTVFSFYRPGDKEALLSNSALLARWNSALDIATHTATQTCSSSTTYACSFFIDVSKLKSMPASQVAGALCDALVDGGTPELRQLVTTYLSSNQSGGIAGALWIVLTSPEYEVN